MDEYSVEDFLNFIETGRRDKISPNALNEIAAECRRLQREVSIYNKETLEKFIIWYWTYIDAKPVDSLSPNGLIEFFNSGKS